MINMKGQKFTDACPPSVSLSHFKQILKDHKQGSSLPSASLSHFIIIKVQTHQALSILNGPRRSKWPNFVSLHIWLATSWLSLKFVCLLLFVYNMSNMSLYCMLCIICLNENYFICVLARKPGSNSRGLWSS